MIISKNRPAGFTALPLLAVLLLVACSPEPAPPSVSKAKEHFVQTTPAILQQVQNELEVTGTIEAARRVRLHNEISGRITDLPLYEGDAAEEQAIVARLDDDLLEAALQKAIATRRQAQIDFDRLKKLKPKNLATDDELARAATALAIATAEERLQQTQVDKSIIRAPFDGIVTERLAEPGDVVPMHSHILTMIDPSSLQVTVRLSEKWIPYIRQGQPAAIQVDALGNTVHTGRVSRIHPTIDALTRKGIVEIAFEPVPAGARAGQLARVRLKTRPLARLLIPSHALHHDAESAYVYTVDTGGIAHLKRVVKGEPFDNRIAIAGGIEAGDRVITRGFVGLRDGKEVTVRNDGDTPPS